jgi:predicted dinucleotide-binding enzyme
VAHLGASRPRIAVGHPKQRQTIVCVSHPDPEVRPPIATIGIIGAGDVGSHIARAAIASGYDVVIANSREPGTLSRLVAELGPSASASTASCAAAAGDFVVVAVPLRLANDMPVEALAGKVVIDTNNYMAWPDGNYPIVDSGEKTEHELRQEQLPASKVVKAFTHIQAPRIIAWGRPRGSLDRLPCQHRAISPRP